MNAERLYAIAMVLNQEMTKPEILSIMDKFITDLQNLVNQPHPTHQENLAKSLQTIRSSLINRPSDNFSPAWRQLLVELGGKNLFGASLQSTIDEIITRNQITLAVALKELQQLRGQLQSFKTALDNLISSFRQFKIGDEKLLPGQCEIGMLIPRKEVDNHLIEFAEELKEIAFILNVFSEVATGKISELEIKTISSSDLMVYLDTIAPFAACLAFAIERIVALYKQLLEIRRLHRDLIGQAVPKEQLAGIEDYANKLMDDGIEKLSAEIVEIFHKEKDKGRKHELTNATRISLNKIANRIDRGYNVEVRVEPIQKTEKEDDATKEFREKVQLIQAASKNMQFMKLEGPPILRLTEAKEKPAEGKEKAKGKKE